HNGDATVRGSQVDPNDLAHAFSDSSARSVTGDDRFGQAPCHGWVPDKDLPLRSKPAYPAGFDTDKWTDRQGQ
ncbi:MAG: hypothetical protein KBF67_06920, partial [Flavobacteriales bacterium]|nr:hypothetical protein [Flavobacteriales bacterium]